MTCFKYRILFNCFLAFQEDEIREGFCERRSGILEISPGCTTLRYMLDVLGGNLSENV